MGINAWRPKRSCQGRSQLHNLTFSQLHGFPVSRFRDFTVSRWHDFTASRFHGFTASRFHGFSWVLGIFSRIFENLHGLTAFTGRHGISRIQKTAKKTAKNTFTAFHAFSRLFHGIFTAVLKTNSCPTDCNPFANFMIQGEMLPNFPV